MKHPYEQIGDYARWDRSVAGVAPRQVDPVVEFPIRITKDQRIVTAGSCFAQHIARYLQDGGFNYYVTEPGHPLLDRELRRRFNYGVFSARYGNLYVTRQLVQLFQRAYGEFTPEEDVWEGSDGLVDPFRPAIQPGGFPTMREYELDREQHFAAVRKAFEQLDVLVFTFGLTEGWVARSDGAAYPLAPGVAGGTYDPERYELVNLGVEDVVNDMTGFIGRLRDVNPRAKVILTVSPVPLFATAIDRHVLVSTTYSKSVLRVAADELVERLEDVYYFPSYEIVTGNFARGAYFAEDLRSIREEGVEHVMSLFFRHATADSGAGPSAEVRAALADEEAAQEFDRRMRKLVDVMCDEELLGVSGGNGAKKGRMAAPGPPAPRKTAGAPKTKRRAKRAKARPSDASD